MSHSSYFVALDNSKYSQVIPSWINRWVENDDEWIWKVVGIAGGSLLCYHFYQKYYQEKQEREDLQEKLKLANNTIANLKEKLLETETNDLQIGNASGDGKVSNKPKKEIRIWLDGVFDMMHYGHMNAFRQARSLGTYLIAGVCSDEDTTRAKGSPVCSEQERADSARGCKWVDEVVTDVPYDIPDGYYASIIEKYKIDYIVHGDDPCIVNGKNVYESAIQLGKFLTIPRTEGISTTEVVGRILSFSDTTANTQESVHHVTETHDEKTGTLTTSQHFIERNTSYLTTARIIRLFGAGVKPPKPTDKVVYIAGTFDMFHAGHIEILEKARQLGDYLIVGVYNDQVANELGGGANFPLLGMFERTLSVLGCKFVDDVLFNASYGITQEMLSSLHIQVVVQATPEGVKPHIPGPDEYDPNAVPKAQGLLQTVTYRHKISVHDYIERIQKQRDRFASRFAKKMEKEKEFYTTKYHL